MVYAAWRAAALDVLNEGVTSLQLQNLVRDHVQAVRSSPAPAHQERGKTLATSFVASAPLLCSLAAGELELYRLRTDSVLNGLAPNAASNGARRSTVVRSQHGSLLQIHPVRWTPSCWKWRKHTP